MLRLYKNKLDGLYYSKSDIKESLKLMNKVNKTKIKLSTYIKNEFVRI